MPSPDIATDKKSTRRDSDNLCTRITEYPISFFKNKLLPRIIPEMTEIRFKKAAFLEGDIFWGQGWDVFAADGRGTDRIVTKAAQLAVLHESQMCQWRFGPKQFVLLPLVPKIIGFILKKYKDHFCDHDSSNSFENMFGRDTIFSKDSNTPEWKHLSSKLSTTLLTDSALEDAMEPMQFIVKRYIEKIKNARGQPINFSQMSNHIGLDMIGIKLGLTNVSDTVKSKAGDLITRGITTVSTHTSQTLKKYFPLLKWCTLTQADKISKEAIAFIKKEIITHNESSILASANWLNPENNLTKKELYEDKTIQRILESYVAGSETSATWLLFTCSLLADPKNKGVLDKLRQEIKDNQIPGEEWTYNSVKNLRYFNMVLDEVLRLYPPIPDLVFQCLKTTEIPETGVLKPNDLLVISPRFIHRLKSEWGSDADEFRPERFEEEPYKSHPNRTFLYFPFGFGKRTCPGRKFARLELIEVLRVIIDNFDLSFADPKMHLPIKSFQCFTLQPAVKDIQLCFTPRGMQYELKPACDKKQSEGEGEDLLEPILNLDSEETHSLRM